jgi:hypothetical protein
MEIRTMKWFRLYHDLPNDRKLRRFNPQQKWAWVVILCLASESGDRGYIRDADDADTADYCGFESTQDYLFFLDKLRQKGMIEPVEGGIKIAHWDERQHIPPSASKEATRERKRKQRAKHQEAEEQSISGYESVAAQAEEKRHVVTPRDVTSSPRDVTTTEQIRSDQKISVDPIITACVLAEPTSEPVGQVNSDWSDDDPKRLAQEKRGTSEQVLAKIPSEMRDLFEKFWTWYCKFCKDRGASAGAKKQAAMAWRDLIQSDFRGHGFEGFRDGLRLFAKRQGDNKSGIPHACRFLFAVSKGSGAWEDAIEQEQSSRASDPGILRPDKGEPARGHSRVYTAADFAFEPEGTPEERKAHIERLTAESRDRRLAAALAKSA